MELLRTCFCWCIYLKLPLSHLSLLSKSICVLKVWKWKSLSRVRLFLTPWTIYIVQGVLQPSILEGVADPFSKGIFPTQRSHPGLPHCRPIPYQLSHKRSSRLLKCVAYPFIHLIFDLSHEVTATNYKRSSLRLLNAWDLCLFLKTSWSPLFQIG